MLRRCAVMAALVLLLSPLAASADWLFTPNIGTGFGGATRDNSKLTYGASIGWMGAGVIGWEADFSYTPEFFEANDSDIDLIDNSNVTSYMGNIILGIPVGGQRGPGFRPYVTGGAGVLKRRVENADQLFTIDNNDFGINLGGGVMGFASDHVGFRGDLRYFRGFSEDIRNDQFDVDLGDFGFWRATGGITFRW
jgi:opacity protein-like surface antigen